MLSLPGYLKYKTLVVTYFSTIISNFPLKINGNTSHLPIYDKHTSPPLLIFHTILLTLSSKYLLQFSSSFWLLLPSGFIISFLDH